MGVALISIGATDGCAVTKRTSLGQVVKVDARGPTISQVDGVGIVLGAKHLAIGWMREVVLEIRDPKDCRLVLIVEKAADLQAVSNLLSAAGTRLGDVCTITRESK